VRNGEERGGVVKAGKGGDEQARVGGGWWGGGGRERKRKEKEIEEGWRKGLIGEKERTGMGKGQGRKDSK